MNAPGALAGLLLLLAVIPTVLQAQDCAPLDPRQQVSEKTTQDIAGAAQTVFKVGRIEGSYKGAAEKEVKNLYDKYPGADRIVLKDKLTYLFCTTLKDSNLSSDRRIKELYEFINTIQDIRGDSRNQANRANQTGDENQMDQTNKTSQIGGGNQLNQLNQVGKGNRSTQSNQ